MLIFAGWLPHDLVRRGAASLYDREFMIPLAVTEDSPFRGRASSKSLEDLFFIKQLSAEPLYQLPR